MNSLDQSHRVVLENLSALRRANRSIEEADQYLCDVAQDVCNDLLARYQKHLAVWEFNKSRIETRHFTNWRESHRHLVTIGLGRLEATGLVRSANSLGCQAYVYSDFLQDHRNDYPADLAFIRNLPPSMDFRPAPERMTGHMFIRDTGGISAEDFMNRDFLKAFIAAPLIELAEWLIANSPAIESHLAATPSETSNKVRPQEIPSATA